MIFRGYDVSFHGVLKCKFLNEKKNEKPPPLLIDIFCFCVDKCTETFMLTFLTIWEMTKLPNEPLDCNFLDRNFQFGPHHPSGECHS